MYSVHFELGFAPFHTLVLFSKYGPIGARNLRVGCKHNFYIKSQDLYISSGAYTAFMDLEILMI